MPAPKLPPAHIREKIRAAFREDWGPRGDITSQFTVPAHTKTRAFVRSHAAGIVAGLAFAQTSFRLNGVRTKLLTKDGAAIRKGQSLMSMQGNARAILAAERVALNYLGHLSGIATTTAQFVRAVRGTKVKIYCTRKTTPGLRLEERYAVCIGGGHMYRMNLSEAVLVKDNHIALSGTNAKTLEAMVASAKAQAGRLLVEIEIDKLSQIMPAIIGGADMLLLDNMSPARLRRALALVDGRVPCEASGNITLQNIRTIVKTGIHKISTSALIQGPWLDIGLDFI